MSPHPGQIFAPTGIFVPQTLHFLLFSGDSGLESTFSEFLDGCVDWLFFLFSKYDFCLFILIREITKIPNPIPNRAMKKKTKPKGSTPIITPE